MSNKKKKSETVWPKSKSGGQRATVDGCFAQRREEEADLGMLALQLLPRVDGYSKGPSITAPTIHVFRWQPGGLSV